MTFNVDKLVELAQKLPEDIRGNALDLVERMGSVIEGIGDDGVEWRPPLLRVVQGTTDRSKLPKDARIGSIILGENVMEQPLRVIPIRTWDIRQRWSPDIGEAKVLCQSMDAKIGQAGQDCYTCPYSQFDEVARRTDCTKSKSFLCVTSDLTQVFQINFSKTNFSFGKDFEGLLRKAGVAIYRRLYDLKTETGAKAKNVEAIKAEPFTNNSVPAEWIDFVKALFDAASDNRKEALEFFRANAAARKGQSVALLETSVKEGDVILLEAASDAEVVVASTPSYTL